VSYARISKSASSSCKKASRAMRSPQPPSLLRAPQGTSAGSPLSYPERHPDGAAPRSAWLRGASTGLPRRAGRVGGATARGRKIPCRSCIAMVPCALLIENRGGEAINFGHTRRKPARTAACEHRVNRRSQALFQCRHCGYTLHADLNTAKNIAAKYRASRGISSAGAPLSTGVSSPLAREEKDKLPPLGDGR
jgi:Putative transposase DNA-binding domain